MYFDTHAHYDDEAFDEDRQALLQKVNERGVSLIINAAVDKKSSEMGIEMAKNHPFIYAAVGWHPHEAKHFNEESLGQIEAWCREEKVVAIGEIGLDYFYDLSEREVQISVFEKQMQLAEKLNLPVIIHDREAHADCIAMLEKFPKVGGVFHCYSGSVEMAKTLLDMGWYLGIGGALTFKNAKKTPDVVKMCPLDRLVLETDCPYLAPVPFRGKRNDSSLLPYVATKIAEIKKISAEKVAEICMENGKKLFAID